MSADAVSVASPDAPGFYGKLPARGDFVGRRLGRSFIAAWDRWLQDALPASRTALGEAWLERYLAAPLWRFALAADCCGPRSVAGVLMASVDKVGRYFPLMVGREIDAVDLCALPTVEPWYEALEALALAALEDGFDLAAFDAPRPLALPEAQPARRETTLAAPGRRLPFAGSAEAWAECSAAMPRAMFWTLGSDTVAASLLLAPSLPAGAAFAALLDGEWAAHGWEMSASSEAPPRGDNAASAWDRD